MKISFLIILLLMSSSITSAQDVKKRFDAVRVINGSGKWEKYKIPYHQRLVRANNDSAFYLLDFEDVTSFKDSTVMLLLRNQAFIRMLHGPVVGPDGIPYQKLLDFNCVPGTTWNVEWLFVFTGASLTFEKKYNDVVAGDTLYQFRVDGTGLASHMIPLQRLYATRQLGIVRMDYSYKSDISEKQLPGLVIFVSDDYMNRRQFQHYLRKGKINDFYVAPDRFSE